MDTPEFSTENLSMLLQSFTKLIDCGEMPEHLQRDLFDRLTTPMKPDPETIECLFLGWLMKYYMSSGFSVTTQTTINDSSNSNSNSEETDSSEESGSESNDKDQKYW